MSDVLYSKLRIKTPQMSIGKTATVTSEGGSAKQVQIASQITDVMLPGMEKYNVQVGVTEGSVSLGYGDIKRLESEDVSNITVSSEPTKTRYLKGQALNLSGLRIDGDIVNANNTSEERDVTARTICSPAEGTIMNEEGTQTVNCTFGDKTTSFNVNVTVREAFAKLPQSVCAEKTCIFMINNTVYCGGYNNRSNTRTFSIYKWDINTNNWVLVTTNTHSGSDYYNFVYKCNYSDTKAIFLYGSSSNSTSQSSGCYIFDGESLVSMSKNGGGYWPHIDYGFMFYRQKDQKVYSLYSNGSKFYISTYDGNANNQFVSVGTLNHELYYNTESNVVTNLYPVNPSLMLYNPIDDSVYMLEPFTSGTAYIDKYNNGAWTANYNNKLARMSFSNNTLVAPVLVSEFTTNYLLFAPSTKAYLDVTGSNTYRAFFIPDLTLTGSYKKTTIKTDSNRNNARYVYQESSNSTLPTVNPLYKTVNTLNRGSASTSSIKQSPKYQANRSDANHYCSGYTVPSIYVEQITTIEINGIKELITLYRYSGIKNNSNYRSVLLTMLDLDDSNTYIEYETENYNT